MDKLPIEIVKIISTNFNDVIDMYSLKLVCKDYNMCINKNSLIKMKLCKKIVLKNKKKLNKCVNNNSLKYRFLPICHRPAMNNDTIYINNNEYKIFSPYCCECLKENILIREIPKNKCYNYYCEGFVDIDYL